MKRIKQRYDFENNKFYNTFSKREQNYNYIYDTDYSIEKPDLIPLVQPLLIVLKKYEILKRQLIENGGNINLINKINRILNENVPIENNDYKMVICLIDQNKLKKCLSNISDYTLIFDVRITEYGLPTYYLCRIMRDYQSQYHYIVEEIFQSPDYEIQDDRFVKLMRMGNERCYLRLCQFRPKIIKYFGKMYGDNEDIDNYLFEIGNNVFQNCWHEDQKPGIFIAHHFALTNFTKAIELLYLCLSSDLCELRSNSNDKKLQFFDKVYDQPAIMNFLKSLSTYEGSDFHQLNKKALDLFHHLSRSFNLFLSLQIPWNSKSTKTTLFNIIFANFYRLDKIASIIVDNKEVLTAAEKLEKTARLVITKINRN